MGNFNILTEVEVNSEDNCRILYSDKALSVLHKFLFWGVIHSILYFTITFWINFYPCQNIEIPTVGPSHLITYPSGLLCKWACNPKLATVEISIFWYRQKLIQNVIVKYNILQIASDTPQNKISCKTDNVLSEYNILQLSSELTSTSVKILKFPMCERWDSATLQNLVAMLRWSNAPTSDYRFGFCGNPIPVGVRIIYSSGSSSTIVPSLSRLTAPQHHIRNRRTRWEWHCLL